MVDISPSSEMAECKSFKVPLLLNVVEFPTTSITLKSEVDFHKDQMSFSDL